ncbi:hypothetical protein FZI91_20805 [Mycobacterium sp. CBMA271]|uniref:DUF2231 domain-containing protein n=1 Tax=unclassified Mycobacteroides TaxID=2618759 RepID=UPI0012DE8589|nr:MULTISPECIES: DUF2231 domain-containing protein [unclassified Mycobacteroides]MUM16882.1 hypothetical protein [Mycobacteroides sp. CBMA 326]MUM24129.1 hypothetical protein [Mycobacteroides sp. CBMA 271]
MNTIGGLPAHVLLVHFVVVLAPLTAVLEILCGLSVAVRSRLVWLVAALSAVTLTLTPITTSAGEWLFDREEHPSEALLTHTERGDWMLVFSGALVLGAIVLAIAHRLDVSPERLGPHLAVAALVLVLGVVSIVGVIRIGDSGAKAVWGKELAGDGE